MTQPILKDQRPCVPPYDTTSQSYFSFSHFTFETITLVIFFYFQLLHLVYNFLKLQVLGNSVSDTFGIHSQ